MLCGVHVYLIFSKLLNFSFSEFVTSLEETRVSCSVVDYLLFVVFVRIFFFFFFFLGGGGGVLPFDVLESIYLSFNLGASWSFHFNVDVFFLHFLQ